MISVRGLENGSVNAKTRKNCDPFSGFIDATKYLLYFSGSKDILGKIALSLFSCAYLAERELDFLW